MSHQKTSNLSQRNVKIFQFRGGPDHHQAGPAIQFVTDPLREKMKQVPGYNSQNNWDSEDKTIVGSRMSKVLRSLSTLKAGEQTGLTLTKYIQHQEIISITPDVNYILNDMRSSRYRPKNYCSPKPPLKGWHSLLFISFDYFISLC